MHPLRRLADLLLVVRDGLRWMGWGLLSATGLLLVGLGLAVMAGVAGGGNAALAFALCVGVFALLALVWAGVGVLVGFYGRCRCLGCPEEFPRARATVRLAVLLESCGWLHLVSSVAFCVAVEWGWLPFPLWIGGIGFAAAGVLLVAGWACFALFCHRLAVAVGQTPNPEPALAVVVPILLVVAALMAAAVIVSGSWLMALSCAAPLVPFIFGGGGLWLAAAVGRLAVACVRSAPPAAFPRNPFDAEPPTPPDESTPGE